MAGLFLLWLVMEAVCDLQPRSHVTLFSNNSPTVSWVQCLTVKGSKVAGQLIRALALHLKVKQVSCGSTKCNDRRPLPVFWQLNKMALSCQCRSAKTIELLFSSPHTELLDCLPSLYKNMYASDFCAANAGFIHGQVVATSIARATTANRKLP